MVQKGRFSATRTMWLGEQFKMTTSSRIATLKRKASAVQKNADQLASSHEKLRRYAEQAISTVEEQIKTLQAKLSVLGLNTPVLRDTICADMNAAAQSWCPKVIATLGSGPWEESEFDCFLQDRGFEPIEPHKSIDGLIVGASDWSEDVLSKQIYDRDASTLRVYTQELFVVGMVIGLDPYEVLDQATIDEFANSHPAIQFIIAREFSWPIATAAGNAGYVKTANKDHNWNQESALMELGYKARSRGPSEATRHRYLRQAFESDVLVGVETREQKQRWGPAYSALRLSAISHFINWLIGFQGPNRPDAKVKWVADLDWLRTQFYKPTMRFTWPVAPAVPQLSARRPPANEVAKARTAPAAQTTLLPQAAWPFPTAS